MKRLSFSVPKWMRMLSLAVFLFAIVSTSTVLGDDSKGDLEETLRKLSEAAATSYVGPIVTAFGSDLNGGWFHRAPSPKVLGFNLEFGLVGMGTLFPEGAEYKNFSVSGTFDFSTDQALDLVQGVDLPPNYEVFRSLIEAFLVDELTKTSFTVGISGPTVIGDPNGEIEIELKGQDFVYTNPITGEQITISLNTKLGLGFGGIKEISDLSFLPLASPQLCLGTVYGTQATFRYLPSITITEEIGKLNYFGFGIQHNPAVWFGADLPVDISGGFFTQTLKIGEIFTAKTTAVGLNVSKRLGLSGLNITPYAGFMIESSKMKVTYDFVADDKTIPIEFELKGENKSRLTVGLSIRLLILNFNADYNFGKFNSFTVGVMFAL